MKDFIDYTDGSTLTPEDYNQPLNEIENAIRASGITLSGSDLKQLAKGLRAYGALGDFYTATGTGNAIILTPVLANDSAVQTYPAYTKGMRIRFYTTAANTGAVTVNIAGLGTGNLKNCYGLTLEANDLPINKYIEASWNGSDFIITNIRAKIGFRAAITTNQIIAPDSENPNGIPIIYDNVIENHGGFYNSSTGKFTPTIPGWYYAGYINRFIECEIGSNYLVEIQKNINTRLGFDEDFAHSYAGTGVTDALTYTTLVYLNGSDSLYMSAYAGGASSVKIIGMADAIHINSAYCFLVNPD